MENDFLSPKATPYLLVRINVKLLLTLAHPVLHAIDVEINLTSAFSFVNAITYCYSLSAIQAISLERVTKALELNAAGVTQLGSMLFTRCVSGAR